MSLVLHQTLLLFHQVIRPDIDQSLQPGRSQVSQRRILPERIRALFSLWVVRLLRNAELLLQPTAQLFRKSSKLFLGCKRAYNHEDFAPFLEVSVLHDIAEIAGNDGL
jgi:hypothetical protein